MKKAQVGCYVRVSTQEQAEHGYSIEEQIERTSRYCKAMGWDVYRTYTDAGFTGSNTDRPGLQQMIRDIQQKKLDKVLVYKLDRLSRSQRDTLELIEDIFLANGADFVSMSENFDTSSPFGRAVIGILAVFAQLEREQIKERMSMGRLARAKKGRYIGSRPPIGYNLTEEGLTPDIYEKSLVQQVFGMYMNGIAPKRIVSYLNESGLTHRYGAWNDRTIRNILENRTYIGEVDLNGERYSGEHEPIIDTNTFEQAQRIRSRRKEEHQILNRRNGRATSLLGGCLYCGYCGAKYTKKHERYHASNGKVYEYDKYYCCSRIKSTPWLVKDPNCKNKIWNMQELDWMILDEIRKLKLDPDYISRIASGSQPAEETAGIEKEIKKVEDQLEKLLDLYTVKDIPTDILQERIRKLNDRKGKLEDELDRITKHQREKLSQQEARKIVTSFDEVISRGDFSEIRQMIGTLIDRIVLSDDEIAIFWAFS